MSAPVRATPVAAPPPLPLSVRSDPPPLSGAWSPLHSNSRPPPSSGASSSSRPHARERTPGGRSRKDGEDPAVRLHPEEEIASFFGQLWVIPSSTHRQQPRVPQPEGFIAWVRKDLVRSRSFTVEDCYPVRRSDRLIDQPTRISFLRDIWGNSHQRKLYAEVVKEMAEERGRWVWQPDRQQQRPQPPRPTRRDPPPGRPQQQQQPRAAPPPPQAQGRCPPLGPSLGGGRQQQGLPQFRPATQRIIQKNPKDQ